MPDTSDGECATDQPDGDLQVEGLDGVMARDAMGNAAIGAIAAGGTIAALTLAYGLVPALARSKKATVIVPFATANEGGAVIVGNF